MPDKSLQIPTADGQADAFAAFPGNGGRHPGVLLYPDAFGVRPVLRQMARELAGHGYYVLVPNRRGPGVAHRGGPSRPGGRRRRGRRRKRRLGRQRWESAKTCRA